MPAPAGTPLPRPIQDWQLRHRGGGARGLPPRRRSNAVRSRRRRSRPRRRSSDLPRCCRTVWMRRGPTHGRRRRNSIRRDWQAPWSDSATRPWQPTKSGRRKAGRGEAGGQSSAAGCLGNSRHAAESDARGHEANPHGAHHGHGGFPLSRRPSSACATNAARVSRLPRVASPTEPPPPAHRTTDGEAEVVSGTPR